MPKSSAAVERRRRLQFTIFSSGPNICISTPLHFDSSWSMGLQPLSSRNAMEKGAVSTTLQEQRLEIRVPVVTPRTSQQGTPFGPSLNASSCRSDMCAMCTLAMLCFSPHCRMCLREFRHSGCPVRSTRAVRLLSFPRKEGCCGAVSRLNNHLKKQSLKRGHIHRQACGRLRFHGNKRTSMRRLHWSHKSYLMTYRHGPCRPPFFIYHHVMFTANA